MLLRPDCYIFATFNFFLDDDQENILRNLYIKVMTKRNIKKDPKTCVKKSHSRHCVYLADSVWEQAEHHASKLSMSVSKLLSHLVIQGAPLLKGPKFSK